ncbi:MAG TPA: hypothetical protein VF533_25735, partial [Solirubrobacteraceae bacterium]
MAALPDSPAPRQRARPDATAAAIAGVSALMAAAGEPRGGVLVAETLVAQARELLDAPAAALLALDPPVPGRPVASAAVVAGDAAAGA